MKKYIIFDLDETLIHTFENMEYYENLKHENQTYKIEFGDMSLWGVFRPNLFKMLNNLKNKYKLAVWSAGNYDYVKKIVEIIFKNIDLEFIWSREKCYKFYDINESFEYYKKPLSKVFNKFPYMNYNNTFIIDDRLDVCSENIFNHIHIPKFDFNNVDINDKTNFYSYISNDNHLKTLNNHLIEFNKTNIKNITNIYFFTDNKNKSKVLDSIKNTKNITEEENYKNLYELE